MILFAEQKPIVKKPKPLKHSELERICPEGYAEVGEIIGTDESGIFCTKGEECSYQSREYKALTAYGVIIDGKQHCRPKCMFAPTYEQNYEGKKK